MAHISPSSQASRLGFTLVEMLVIAPVILLTITVFIAVMINMVGDVMRTHAENDLAYQTQTALDQIERDVRLSNEFLSTSGTLRIYQGSNNNFNGTSAFTVDAENTLILNTIATNKNPDDPDRTPVYYANQPYACGPQQTFNDMVHIKVIYFIKDSSLWRRTVLPTLSSSSVCDDMPWQKDSCSPGHPSVTQCRVNDMELMNGIDELDLAFYIDAGDTSSVSGSDIADASTVRATITGASTAAGRDISSKGMIRVTKLNSI